jgi:pilus assembly protein Flp/PilA
MRLMRCEDGATAIEYGLICGLLTLICMVGINSMAGGTSSMWGRIGTNVTAATN